MKGVRLYVKGDYALFTRPEAKVERVSYDVPTPSAARGILEAIHWKPAISWRIDKIHVLNPIQFDSVRRNEVKKIVPVEKVRRASKGGVPLEPLLVEDCRVQRASLVLRNVAYIIEAHFELTDKAGPDDNEGKHIDIFRRRAKAGQCFQQPCFGCREFPAFFSMLEDNEPLPQSSLVNEARRDLGIMLYDIDFANGMKPIFYHPFLEQGIIHVARDKEEFLCRHI